MLTNHAMTERMMNSPSVKTQVKLMSVTNLMTGHVILEGVENLLMIKLHMFCFRAFEFIIIVSSICRCLSIIKRVFNHLYLFNKSIPFY